MRNPISSRRENLDNLVKENFVLDATIYDYNGKELAQSTNTGNLREQLGLEHKNEGEFSTQQIVEPFILLLITRFVVFYV